MVDVNIKGELYGIVAALELTMVANKAHVINVLSATGHKFGPCIGPTYKKVRQTPAMT
ncbi:hypothetical protein [Paraburkholderia sp. 40]|uniref:hypothetical protein n=1 Tax=Paraburkholderia sp. 40 TaxID=2991059 RepID=UPI003D1C86DC